MNCITQEDISEIKKIFSNIVSVKGKIAVMGAGSSLNGDDAAGPAVAEALARFTINSYRGNLRVYNGCTVMENFTGEIRRFKPDVLFIIDAADFGGIPGSIRLLDRNDVRGFSLSSHMLPIGIMTDYLEREIHCRAVLIGIQPESVAYGTRMSKSVSRAVKLITAILKREIKKFR
jgi:hydrogenase 3 maturation protease